MSDNTEQATYENLSGFYIDASSVMGCFISLPEDTFVGDLRLVTIVFRNGTQTGVLLGSRAAKFLVDLCKGDKEHTATFWEV